MSPQDVITRAKGQGDKQSKRNIMKNSILKIAGLMLLAVMAPAMASATTNEELQAQINALIAQLQAQGGAVSAAQFAVNDGGSCTFTKQLSLGMYDPEVTNLQRILNQSADTQVASYGAGSPGEETDFFGERTRVAVIRFQNKYASSILAPMGLTYGTGAVGVATRAQLHELCAQSGGAVLGASIENTSGNIPTTITTNTNTNTGSNGSNNYGLNGSAGSISINSYNADIEDNVTTGAGKYVLGFKVRADGSDVRVSNVRLTLNYNGSNNNNLNRYFDAFEIYANGSQVGRVNASDFNRDGSGQFSKSVNLDNAIVRMGSGNQVIFYVRAIGTPYIDSALAGSSNPWTVRADNIRFNDATGYTFSDNSSVSNSGVYVEKLSTSSDVKVRISTGSGNPDERTVFVSDTGSGDKVTMLEYRLKAEGTDVQFDQVRFNVSTTGASAANQASEFQLQRDGSTLATADATAISGGVLTFNLDNLARVNRDNTGTFTVVARMLKIGTGSFPEGSSMTVSFSSVNAQDQNGDNINSYSGSATGRPQTFRSTGLNIARVSSYTNAVQNSYNPSASYGEYRTQVRITASGNDIWVPFTIGASTSTTGVVYSMEDASNNVMGSGATTASVALVSGGTRDGNYVKIADGESATIEIVVTYDPTSAGQYRLQINSVGYTTSGPTGAATAQIVGTPEGDFQSSNLFITN